MRQKRHWDGFLAYLLKKKTTVKVYVKQFYML